MRRGDTLSHIARRYDTTVAMLRRANRLRSSFLGLGWNLTVPLRGPCTRCPMPPPVVVPPRRLPPTSAVRDGGVVDGAVGLPDAGTGQRG